MSEMRYSYSKEKLGTGVQVIHLIVTCVLLVCPFSTWPLVESYISMAFFLVFCFLVFSLSILFSHFCQALDMCK